jgi:hypothetical protein
MTTPRGRRAVRQGELSGVLDETQTSITAEQWLMPVRVQLVGDMIVPTWPEGAPPIFAHGSDDLLRRFLALAEAPDSRILGFARTHGLLGLSVLSDPHADPLPAPEPVEEWRKMAKRAATVILLASRMSDGDSTHARPGGVFGASFWLCGEIDHWMWMADVRPYLVWTSDGPTVVLGSRTLLSGIAVRLLHAVAGGGGQLEYCPDCRLFRPVQRRRPAGIPFYCEDHRGKAAAARFRERNRRLGADRPRSTRGQYIREPRVAE